MWPQKSQIITKQIKNKITLCFLNVNPLPLPAEQRFVLPIGKCQMPKDASREEGWHDLGTDFTHIDWKESHNSCHPENTWTEKARVDQMDLGI